MATVIRDELKRLPWEPEHYVYSFHGLPQKYAQAGDPYPTQVVRTTRGLQERLQFSRDRWTQTYQSLFGRGEWLRPYTDDVLAKLARQGVKRVFVMTPGFTADCLETLDEIGHESREHFRAAGGEELHQCRCLNDHPAWIEAMRTLVTEEGQGWLAGSSDASSG
jgi:ferrochelatase